MAYDLSAFGPREQSVGVEGPVLGGREGLLRSTVQVGPSSAQEQPVFGNLSVLEGLYCSELAPCRSVRVLNWLEWPQGVVPSCWEGLMFLERALCRPMRT